MRSSENVAAVAIRICGPDASDAKYHQLQKMAVRNTRKGTITVACSGLLFTESLTVVTSLAPSLALFLRRREDGLGMMMHYRVSIEIVAECGDGQFAVWQNPSIIDVVMLDGVTDGMRQLLREAGHEWTLGYGKESITITEMASIVIFSLAGVTASFTDKSAPFSFDKVDRFRTESRMTLARGSRLMTVSSPFASQSISVFINHRASGVVSAVISEDLMVTDAQGRSGSEGGAVLNSQDETCIGMLIAPLMHKRSAIHLSLFVPLSTLSRNLSTKIAIDVAPARPVANFKTRLESALCHIVAGDFRGTGFWVTDTLIVTCAHVILPAIERSVKQVKFVHAVRIEMQRDDGEWIVASDTPTPLFVTSMFHDLALLRVTDAAITHGCIPLTSTKTKTSRDAVALGYPFPRRLTVTAATVGRSDAWRVRVGGWVIDGFSGGPVCDVVSGSLVGVISGNCKLNAADDDGGVAVPQIGFLIPAQRVRDLVSAFGDEDNCGDGDDERSERLKSLARLDYRSSVDEIWGPSIVGRVTRRNWAYAYMDVERKRGENGPQRHPAKL